MISGALKYPNRPIADQALALSPAGAAGTSAAGVEAGSAAAASVLRPLAVRRPLDFL